MAASSSYTRPYGMARSNEWWEQPEDQLRREFRMCKQTFQMICIQLETALSNRRSRNSNVTVEEHVAVTIWRLATAATYHELSQKFGIAVGSCKSTLQRTISAIHEVLTPNWVCWPDRSLMNNTKEWFLRESGIPNVGGVVYTTHVPMFPPATTENMFYNHKHTERAWEALGRRTNTFKFTTTLQGAVDHRGLFTELCVGYPGRCTHHHILKKSSLYGWNLRDVWIVGTSSHPLLDWLLVPYTHGNLTPQQQNFNEKLGIIQDVAKNAFQKLKRIWGVFQKESRLEVEDLNQELRVCCVLHNICEVRHEQMYPEWNYELFDDETVPENRMPSLAAIRARDQIANSLPLAP